MCLVGLDLAVQSNVRINFNAIKKNQEAQKSYVYKGGLPFLSTVSLHDVNSLFCLSNVISFSNGWSYYVRMCTAHYLNDKEVTNGLYYLIL